jgi:ribosomal protein S18 acetylase RimI-like enzyme
VVIEAGAPQHVAAIRTLLDAVDWEERYVQGQLEAVERGWNEPDAATYVSELSHDITGFVAVGLSRWNMLGRIDGLVVHPRYRRRGHGSALVAAAESFLGERSARGLYVDTPVSNHAARAFYVSRGYREDHVMSRYYGDDLDGVTYVRFFR